MRECLECQSPIVRRKFCSKACAGKFRSRNTVSITEEALRADYERDRLELQEIGKRHGISVGTVCKYLRLYKIEQRGNHIDFTGQKIGNLTVVEALNAKSGNGKHVRWRCICDCGNECYAWSHHLSRSLTARCKDCVGKARRSELELKKYMWTNIRRSATNRGMAFEIEREWAYDLFLAQSKCCALSGLEIQFAECAADYNKGLTTASLDRIDSNLDYVVGNVQWVHKSINFMKQALNQDRFIELCGIVSNFQRVKNAST